MKINRTLAWSLINNESHPGLPGKERTIEGVMPVIEELFPGMNYYSVTGFGQVKEGYLRPVLTKLFPDLGGLDASEVRPDEKVEIKAFLPSKGYEHLDNPEWRKTLDRMLVK